MKQVCDIIIPIWNQPELTKQCIEAVQKNTQGKIQPHLILIDNGSTEETQTYLASVSKQFSNEITLFRFPQNQGFPKAINQGLKLSKASFVCFLNNDVTVTPNWLDQLCISLESDPHLGALYASQITSFDPSQNLNNYAKKNHDENKGKLVECNTLVAHCVVLKRDVIEKVGPMDEAFSPGYWEDVDYGLRVLKAGYKMAYALDTVVLHPKESSFRMRKDAKAIYERSANIFQKKWGKPHYYCYIFENVHLDFNKISQLLYESTKNNNGYVYVKSIFRLNSNNKTAFLNQFSNFHRNVIFIQDTKSFFRLRMFFKILFRSEDKQYQVIYVDSFVTKILFSCVGFLRGIKVKWVLA